MWLPDVFGYSGALPQIMAGCGVKYFSTQKIFWNYNGGEPFPYNSFWWEGIDGTRVLAHIHNDYNSHTNPAKLMQRWNERAQKDGIRARLMPFGYGDGGGGPTRLHLEYLRRCADLEGLPRTRQASPVDFFKDLEADAARLPAYVGELYFQAHRGTLTSQARTKRGNRKGEFALREAEFWGVAARALAGFDWPATSMEGAWKGLLLNQFHDILPGSSIERVYQEAEALYEKVLGTARSVAVAAARKLTSPDAKAVTVFNSLSWERTALVALPRGFAGARAGGVDLPVQRIGGATHVEARIPACGWQTLESARPPRTPNTLKASPTLLENDLLRLRFNALGEIVSLFDKEAARELAAAPMNSFRMYKDVPRSYDAWDLDSPYELQPVALPGRAEVKVVAAGPLVAVLRVRRTLGRSVMTQEIRLRRGSRRIDFVTRVDWREKHKLLKVAFPTTLHANEALHEVQFGHLPRPNHRSRPFDADRFEVANQKWTALAESARGVAVLNDCKYGVNVLGGSINLTLLKSPVAPDMRADQGMQEFTYSFLAWNGPFAQSGVTQQAYDLNAPALTLPGRAGEASLFTVEPANVVLDTLKPAEDGSGDLIVRLYESDRAATTALLRTALPLRRAAETDMLEANPRALPLRRGALRLEFRPFEIKTLRLTPG
jgi:alpha-mannosidase